MVVHQTVLTPGQMKDLAGTIVQAIPSDLSAEDARDWIGHRGKLQERVRASLRRLLQLVGTVDLPAIPRFVAREKFRHGEVTDGVRVYLWGDNFFQHFLDKVEEDVPATTLHVHRLRRASVDGPIITELGGDKVVVTALAHVWEMLKTQANGQKGNFLVNGYANIFYCLDAQGKLWAVYCGWSADDSGWRVIAGPVTSRDGWSAGGQVFSRDSSAA